VAVLRAWLAEQHGDPADPLFPASHGGPLSRDAVERLLTKHAKVAQRACPSLTGKRLSPHTLRHTSAMRLLHAGVDTTVIALWLGHETTRTADTYLHADLALKEKALARTAPPNTRAGRYQAPDSCSPSWPACDYADKIAPSTPPEQQKPMPCNLRSA
jgi:integrase/recombinase XerD